MTKQRKEPSTVERRNRGRALHMLCAEDNERLAELLKYALEQAGHKVECVADGQAALDRITANLKAFDLLVTDHRMARLSGLHLVEKLRDTAFAGKIIVHSAYLPPAVVGAYRRMSVDHILIKPAQLDELFAAIEKIGETIR